MRAGLLLFTWLFLALPAAAQGWSEPARGTAERQALMDAMRPHAEWQLGAPVVFVVRELRVAGDLAFARLTARRPGGEEIDLYATPGHARGEIDPSFSDAREIHALYRKSGATWVAVHFSLGATDVWWSWDPLCADYRPVIAEYCEF